MDAPDVQVISGSQLRWKLDHSSQHVGERVADVQGGHHEVGEGGPKRNYLVVEVVRGLPDPQVRKVWFVPSDSEPALGGEDHRHILAAVDQPRSKVPQGVDEIPC